MASLIELPTFTDTRGSLTVIEKILPFAIKRVYYLYNITKARGGHKHKKTFQALIAVHGSCQIYVENSLGKKNFVLKEPKDCLILNPDDWHTMDGFSKGSVLLVLASQIYNKNDYIMEK